MAQPKKLVVVKNEPPALHLPIVLSDDDSVAKPAHNNLSVEALSDLARFVELGRIETGVDSLENQHPIPTEDN
jgi:hypothetical protein